MEWSRYYENTEVTPFRKQEPAYRFLLSRLVPTIEHSLPLGEKLNLVLGGVHPAVTHPNELTAMAGRIFPGHPLSTFVVDINELALNGLTGDGFTKVQSPLENMPESVPPIHLLVLDFTLDFMDDRTVSRLNQTLPGRLHPLGVVALANYEPVWKSAYDRYNQFKYGVRYYSRNQAKVQALFSHLKPLVVAETEDNCRISLWGRPDHPCPAFSGLHLGLFRDEGPYAQWLHQDWIKQQTASDK